MSTATPLYGLRVLTLGVALVASGLALSFWMFRTTLGPFAFLASAHGPVTRRAAVWVSGDAASRRDAARRWGERLGDVEVVESGAELTRGSADLAIWDGVTLDAESIATLSRFLDEGGAAGLFGVRDADEGGANAPVLTALTALWGSGPMRSGGAWYWRLEAGASGPLRAGMAMQEGIPLRRVSPAYALDEAGAEIYWGAERANPPAAAWRAEVGPGRVAWLAVPPDAVLDRTEAHVAMASLVQGMLAWLTRTPFAELVPSETSASATRALRGIRTRIKPVAPNRFELALSHEGDVPVTSVALRVHLNREVAGAEIAATMAGDDVPVQHFQRGSRALDLAFSGFAPGESRSYYLDLLPVETRTARRGSPAQR